MFDQFPPNVRHWHDKDIIPSIQSFFADQHYDFAFLGDLVSIPYAQACLPSSLPWFIDRARVDAEFQRQKDLNTPTDSSVERLTRWLRRRMTQRHERVAAHEVTAEIVCAPSDKIALSQIIGTKTPIEVVANGIEAEEFPDQGELTSKPTIMLPGAMDYQPNADGALWFLEHRWPTIAAALPEAELFLLGATPFPKLCVARPAKCNGDRFGRFNVTVVPKIPRRGGANPHWLRHTLKGCRMLVSWAAIGGHRNRRRWP